jgi:hypothetical protein
MANSGDLRLTIVPSSDDHRERDVDTVLTAFEEKGISFSRVWTPADAPEILIQSFVIWWDVWWSWWRMLGLRERDFRGLVDASTTRPAATDGPRAPIGTWPTVAPAPIGSDTISEVAVDLAPTAGHVIGTIVGTWLMGHSGRKVRLKSGDVEVEAQTPQQVDALLSLLEQLRETKATVARLSNSAKLAGGIETDIGRPRDIS